MPAAIRPIPRPPRARLGARRRRAHRGQRAVRGAGRAAVGAVARAGRRAELPEPWTPPPGGPPDRIRALLGLPATTPICLFWGRLGPTSGSTRWRRPILLVPDAVLVVMGFGRGWDAQRRARRRPALRRPASHDSGGPPRRARVMDRLGRRRDGHAAAALVQPALHDPEQVPRGARCRHADRARPGPADDGRDPRARGGRAGRRVHGARRRSPRRSARSSSCRSPNGRRGATGLSPLVATATAGRSPPRRTSPSCGRSIRPRRVARRAGGSAPRCAPTCVTSRPTRGPGDPGALGAPDRRARLR